MSAEDPSINALAMDMLRRALDRSEGAEEASAKGIAMGIELGLKRAEETASAERTNALFAGLERLVDKVMDRLEAAEVRRAAANTPPPPPVEEEPSDEEQEAMEQRSANLLETLARRPPPEDAAEALKAAGIPAAMLPDYVEQVRAEPAWAAFLDEDPDWVAGTIAALEQLEAS